MSNQLRYTATRVAMWFIMESKRMAKQGKTAQEIIERLNDFRHVLKDWRDNSTANPLNLPSDQLPEFWESDALEKFIAKFSVEASDAERLIKINWSGQVDSDEMRRCAEEIGVKAPKMRPGFRVLTDMTDLESMDHAGAPYIGSVMDLCVTWQVEHVVRVIPDPHKDIGLNIMSYFHFGSKIRVTNCENLADAMRRLAE